MNFENDDIIHAPTTSSLILEERHDSELFRVYALILDGITDQVLLPGKKLTESELCRQMVCSRNTVRGALSLLAHDKIVDLQPNRGAFVHVPDLKEMQDVFNARIEMETMILNILADLPDLETRLKPLYAMIRREEEASGRGDRVGWNRLSNAFHVELARLVGNDVLFDIMNTLCARSSLIVAVAGVHREGKTRHQYAYAFRTPRNPRPAAGGQAQPRGQNPAPPFGQLYGAFGKDFGRLNAGADKPPEPSGGFLMANLMPSEIWMRVSAIFRRQFLNRIYHAAIKEVRRWTA
ncbi:GntR family transcriptional regulator [Neisseria meningitidis]|nr:GntR family transcriptional regulator [Neisseria meningitidis]